MPHDRWDVLVSRQRGTACDTVLVWQTVVRNVGRKSAAKIAGLLLSSGEFTVAKLEPSAIESTFDVGL